jgi:DNA helicase-2/ATP-dependent DNA helicase PcrA
MVERKLEVEVVEIFRLIGEGHNFLLSGGAGSGKTYSLVQVIKTAISQAPTAKIACMTYTNAAVKEIEHRVDHKNLNVTTIHDFLWDSIKIYQRELKKALITLINDDASPIKSPDGIVPQGYFSNLENGIQYKEWNKIQEGIISHDEVIELAYYMFTNNPKLCDIIKDKYAFIFIDEYQDTHPLVVKIFLEELKKSDKKNIIGFFGDAMQSIYDEGVGDLNPYIESGDVMEVQKVQNRRNPQLVISLANRLRADGIVQEPSADIDAPNMHDGQVKPGNIQFIYSRDNDINRVKQAIGWRFDENSKETKELNLTHNLIAPRAGFSELMDIYNADKILEFKRRVVSHIKENNITTDFSASSFGEVVDVTGVQPTPAQRQFIDAHPELLELAREYPYSVFSKIYVDKDALIDDKKQDEIDESKKGSKRDNLVKHLFKIQNHIHLYRSGRFNEFVRRTEYQITSAQHKDQLKAIIDTLEGMSDDSIEDVISFADETGICPIDDKLRFYLIANEYLFERVKNVSYQKFQNLYYYLEGHTPFSTQHKIKGDEFNNVFVVMDNGGWNNYNFEYLFNPGIIASLTAARRGSFPRILARSQKIFYVCCTRAKENLIVYYHNPSDQVLATARTWFGDGNVREV